MQIDHVFMGIESGKEIKAFVDDKTSKLKKYFQGKIHAKWVLSKEKEDFSAHLHVLGNSIDYFGEAQTDDILSSVELALDHVERQLKKHKEIVKDHHKA